MRSYSKLIKELKKCNSPPPKFKNAGLAFVFSLFLAGCAELDSAMSNIQSQIQGGLGSITQISNGVDFSDSVSGSQLTAKQQSQLSSSLQYRGSVTILKQAFDEAKPNMEKALTYFACHPYDVSVYNKQFHNRNPRIGIGPLESIAGPLGSYQDKSSFHPRDKCLTVAKVDQCNLTHGNSRDNKYTDGFYCAVHYKSDYSNHKNAQSICAIEMKRSGGSWKVKSHCLGSYQKIFDKQKMEKLLGTKIQGSF